MKYKVEITYKNVKYLRARIVNDIVKVSAPYMVSKKTIEKFLKDNEDYIIETIKKNQNKKINQEINFNDRIFIFDNYYTIYPSKVVKLTESFIFLKENLDIKKQINLLFKNKQLLYFQEKTKYYYRLMNITKSLPQVMIKDVKTRYGSYNRKSNVIVYASSLLYKDPCVYDYIVVHELAHMIEFNHSKAFYAIVEKYCPNYKNLIKILKEEI